VDNRSTASGTTSAVTRAPSEVVAAEPEALRAAARRLDRGAFTVDGVLAAEGFLPTS
jgi:hypothetical protein